MNVKSWRDEGGGDNATLSNSIDGNGSADNALVCDSACIAGDATDVFHLDSAVVACGSTYSMAANRYSRQYARRAAHL